MNASDAGLHDRAGIPLSSGGLGSHRARRESAGCGAAQRTGVGRRVGGEATPTLGSRRVQVQSVFGTRQSSVLCAGDLSEGEWAHPLGDFLQLFLTTVLRRRRLLRRPAPREAPMPLAPRFVVAPEAVGKRCRCVRAGVKSRQRPPAFVQGEHLHWARLSCVPPHLLRRR